MKWFIGCILCLILGVLSMTVVADYFIHDYYQKVIVVGKAYGGRNLDYEMAVHPLNPKFKDIDIKVSLGTYSRFEKGDTIHIALPNNALVKPVPVYPFILGTAFWIAIGLVLFSVGISKEFG